MSVFVYLYLTLLVVLCGLWTVTVAAQQQHHSPNKGAGGNKQAHVGHRPHKLDESQKPGTDMKGKNSAMMHALQGGNGNKAAAHHHHNNMQFQHRNQRGRLGPQLRCAPSEDGRLSYNISERIHVQIANISDYDLKPDCPCAHDGLKKCRQSPHMCVASSMNYFCTFTMSNVVVTDWGALLDGETNNMIQFNHATIGGGKEPMYFPMINSIYLKGFEIAVQKHNPSGHRPVYNLVVPTRTRWDDCFNHLSFQSMPMIAMTYKFHRPLWHNITWQASKWTGAMLVLLGVKEENLRLEKQLLAKELLLPWVPHWNPVQIASYKGIAKEMAKEMTDKLVSLKFTDAQKAKVKPIFVATGVSGDGEYHAIEKIDEFLASTKKRFVVYLSRAADATRAVVNENELLRTLNEALSDDYQLVILGPTPPYKEIDDLLVLWQRYAKIVSRAKVFIGPHGGGMNNIMWAPEDCHMVEFNEFPDDDFYTKSHGETPVRTVFLTGFFAKAGSGEYYNVAASKKHPKNFYEGKMRVSTKEVLQVFSQIEQGKVLKAGYKFDTLPDEPHLIWTEAEQKVNTKLGDAQAIAIEKATKGKRL